MAENIQETLTRLTEFISQNYSDVETGPGSVINELLLKLSATLHNNQYNLIEELNQGNNIAAAINSETDTYSNVIDEIASNYNLTRNTGFKATGKIKVTVSGDNDYNLRAGLTFIQPSLNLSYYTLESIRVSSIPSAELNEIQLYENQGMYYFIIDVIAADVGEEYQVSSGTIFSLGETSFVSNFVKAEAYGNFSSGKALETDKQLINRIRYGLSHSKLESPIGISNKFASTYSGFQTLQVCGANDAELVRDSQNALGIATFGKADVYVRSSLGIQTVKALKTAKKIAADTWEMEFKNYEFPGFYNIKSILPNITTLSLTGTLDITSVDFGFSLYQENKRNNNLSNYLEARFTKYQTAKVLFTYKDSPISSIGTVSEFSVLINSLPYIAEMQDLLLLDDQRLACADYLVKAVIPCMVSLEINLIKKRPTDTYDSLELQKLKQDIFTYINSIPFGAELHASNIVDLCHNYNIKRVDLPIQMRGLILCPDGSSISLSDSDILSIPKRLDKGVTPNTTLYFVDYYKTVDGITNPIDNIGLNIN
jgi:hypothetical protein